MNMPGFAAEASIYTTVNRYSGSPAGVTDTGSAMVIPQQSICGRCIRVPGPGRICITFPQPFGRRCATVNSLGSWRLCCRLRIGIPPVSCGAELC
jgi:hypothetical protein